VRELVVYGASGFGQQVMFWVEDAVAENPRYVLSGYVDDDPATHGEVRSGYPVNGGREWLIDRAEERNEAGEAVAVVLSFGFPDVKRAVHARLADALVEYPVIVHPSAVISRHASLARGVVVGPGSIVGVQVRLDELAMVATNCTVGHEASLGRYSTLLPGVNVSGRATIGEATSVGTGTAITQGVEIGAGVTGGAGATVVDDLPDGCVAVGTPARARPAPA
jgi:sugar O-acyltransferase (sialic acid O-acetyltransferase NeuD family)